MKKKQLLIEDPEDLELFVGLCDQYWDVMYRTARAILTGRNSRHVDDAVQAACISLATNIKLIKIRVPCSKQRGFIVRIVKNKAIDIIRQEQKRTALSYADLEFMAGTDSDEPLNILVQKEGYERVLAAINSLEDIYRDVLGFKIIDGLTDHEIASILNITPKNVNVRTFRAKKKLREILQRGL